jgi:hypothetical protein
MSWQQDYSFPSFFDLFRKITNKNLKDIDIINSAIASLKYYPLISKIEQIVVDDDPYGGYIYGTRITLANGRIFETVENKKKSYTHNGNYGCDIYEWKEVKK